ncbi:MAG: chorismate-binding protein [Candidatus Jacksonbacteria bacterium]
MPTKQKFNFKKPFAIIRRKEENDVLILQGTALELDKLSDIPRRKGKDKQGEVFDTISILPFSQIKERGLEARDRGAKIICVKISRQTKISVKELNTILPQEDIILADGIKYNYTEEEYKLVIKNVIKNEIGNGEGANFVIPRTGTAKIKNISTDKVLSIYKNILKGEIGSYWTFLFFDGNRYFVGATPERHISVQQRKVLMNPISGTFRKNEFLSDYSKFSREFKKFLRDKKEINELFMVVDEELKMMADICDKGGMIIGPLLKEMSELIHTEYLLSGKSAKDIIDILRRSMFAATVTGSPVENACRIIKKYEPEDRGYYGSALVLIGRDKYGNDILDSPITIRTAKIDKNGELLLKAGATLVRDSKPAFELKETKAKMAAMLNSIQNPQTKHPKRFLPKLNADDQICELLQQRNQELSKFWFFNQENEDNSVPELKGKKVIIIDNEDGFCYMLKHMIAHMGALAKIVKFSEYNFNQDRSDIVVVGPGTGNPNQTKDKKMKIVYNIVQGLLKSKRKFCAVCLGHQILCRSLGIKVEKKKNPSQGVAETITFCGRKERVGFYNTFTGKYKNKISGVNIDFNPDTKEIYALRSEYFASFQFHPESILTQNGFDILKNAFVNL